MIPAPGQRLQSIRFGSVAEGNDQHSFGACRDACGQPVHLRVVERLLRDIAAYPRIHDARAVDAEQNAVTGIAGRVIDVDEGIHARLRGRLGVCP